MKTESQPERGWGGGGFPPPPPRPGLGPQRAPESFTENRPSSRLQGFGGGKGGLETRPAHTTLHLVQHNPTPRGPRQEDTETRQHG